jgi:hypothetical protein
LLGLLLPSGLAVQMRSQNSHNSQNGRRGEMVCSFREFCE